MLCLKFKYRYQRIKFVDTASKNDYGGLGPVQKVKATS